MKVERWGVLPYQTALARQMELVHLVAEGDLEELVVMCSHPPVVTLGRGTQLGDLTTWSGDVVEIQRGGRATYHGPSQVVAYPILNLTIRGRDLHLFIRNIERAVIETLKTYGVDAHASEGNTGVWVGNRKIASIGIAVKKWVSYHGVAINLDHDPEAFQGLNPCGFSSDTMVSLEALVGKKISHEDFENQLVKSFDRHLKITT